MMPTIRVEDDVFRGLQSLAQPFTDTPNSVIRRLLEEKGMLPSPDAPKASNEPEPEKRTRPVGLTPQTTYERFLLQVLAAQPYSGTGHKHEVTRSVFLAMKQAGLIGTAEMQHVSTGETRAENTVAWARNALKERGLLKRNSHRGIWELTPEGLKEASQQVVMPATK